MKMFHPAKTDDKGGRFSRPRAALCLIALIAVSATAAGAISASADRTHTARAANKLVGSWMVTVTRPGLPTLKSLHTYSTGRGVIESANSGGARSTSHGAWQWLGGRSYASTKVFFRYAPADGAYLGTVKIRQKVEVARDGQSFSGVAVGELRDPAGNLLPGSNIRRDTVTGERVNVEPIPTP